MYTLYWISKPEHTNPYSEGYIGITSQSIQERFNEHKYNHKNRHLRNRCNQDSVYVKALHENLSAEEARSLEETYRPVENIGWNINKGGDLPPSRLGKVAEKTILVGEQRTEKQKAASKAHSERMKGTKHRKGKRTIFHYKNCITCDVRYETKHPKTSKFCSKSCFAKYNNVHRKRKKK